MPKFKKGLDISKSILMRMPYTKLIKFFEMIFKRKNTLR